MKVRSILLIDDDADDRALFCEALAEVAPKIDCNSAANGRKALAKLNNQEIERPDLIFLDINLVGINGWNCLSILKEQGPYKNIPVIMYSTSSLEEDVKKARNLGALFFFTKPSAYGILKSRLMIVLDHFHNNSLSALSDGTALFIKSETKE